MTISTISTLPTAPAMTDPPATFISRADAFLAALVTMQSELNTSIGEMNTDIGQANTDAATVTSLYDSFDDRYLGAKSSDPALDNDGDALLTGALYWNTVSDVMKAYTGSSWQVVADLSGTVFLTSVTASNDASIDFDNTILDGTYDEYIFRFINVVPSSDSVIFTAQVSTDNGSTYLATGYRYVATNYTFIILGQLVGSAANENGVSGNMTLMGVTSSTEYKGALVNTMVVDSSGNADPEPYPQFNIQTASAIDAVKFYFGSGNVESGTISVYGVRR